MLGRLKLKLGAARRFPRLRQLSFATATACSLLAAATSAKAEDIAFMAGSSGGTWHGLAGALKAIFETSVPDVTFNIRPGSAIGNALALEKGESPIGFLNSVPAVDGINGKPPFETPLKNICSMATLHGNTFHLISVDSEVNGFADLKGKRFGTLARGSHPEAMSHVFLGYHGLTKDDLAQFNMGSFNDNVGMLKDGHIDVFFTASGVPNGPIMELTTSTSDARILPISDQDLNRLREDNIAWQRIMIPASAYAGQSGDIPTVTYPVVLAANCSTMSEERAYLFTKALIANFSDLGAVVADYNHMSTKDLVTDSGIPMHSGSVRAYKEAGQM